MSRIKQQWLDKKEGFGNVRARDEMKHTMISS